VPPLAVGSLAIHRLQLFEEEQYTSRAREVRAAVGVPWMSKGGPSSEVQWQFKINTYEEYGKGYGHVWKDFEDACQTGAENNWQIERDFQDGCAEATISYKINAHRTQDETCLRIDFEAMEVKNLHTQKVRAIRRCQVTGFFEGRAYITVG
jgi:hypothetical protein